MLDRDADLQSDTHPGSDGSSVVAVAGQVRGIDARRSTAPESSLPTGTVTFFFTDTEGSTRLLGQLGDAAYAEVLARQRRHITQAVSDRRGVVFGTEGDAIFCVFESATGAVDAAVDASGPWRPRRRPAPVRTRIRLHTGEALLVGDDYVGTTVHFVARVTAAAHGGQVIASDAVSLPCPGHPLDRPRSASAQGHRTTSTPVPGGHRKRRGVPAAAHRRERADQSAPVARHVRRSRGGRQSWPTTSTGRGLVTLVGPGGVGKTRLATETARGLRAHYPGGVHLVELAKVLTPRECRRCGGPDLRGGRRPWPDLPTIAANWVREDSTLLVLDNCEHLIEEAAPGDRRPAHRAPVAHRARDVVRTASHSRRTCPPAWPAPHEQRVARRPGCSRAVVRGSALKRRPGGRYDPMRRLW